MRVKPPAPRRARRSTLASRAALALALLGALGQVASFAHLLLVRHAVCPEHGELVHRDAPDARAATESATPTAGYRALGLDEADHAHAHCASALQRKDKFALTSNAACDAIAAEACVALPCERAQAERSSAIYRLAPKTSPPV